MVLNNDAKRRKALATYRNVSPVTGTDHGTIQYFKDGKATGFTNHNGQWQDRSRTPGYESGGFFEWLRLHKEDKKVWWMARVKGDAYGFATYTSYPRTTYFNEDTDD